jgi:3-deoxy-D-manno-octulosonate 8-phosphate phosphatase (KDO 8-P phosphatase)
MENIRERAEKIRLVIFDVDGVLTDGRLFFDEQGHEYKSFHARDGLGIKLLQKVGIEVAAISGRVSQSAAIRLAGLGIEHVYQGQVRKLQSFEHLCEKLSLQPEQVAHVGDDLVDLCLLTRVGLAVVVADAHPWILPHAHWRTRHPGGQGAAREVCDLILESQGHAEQLLAEFR